MKHNQVIFFIFFSVEFMGQFIYSSRSACLLLKKLLVLVAFKMPNLPIFQLYIVAGSQSKYDWYDDMVREISSWKQIAVDVLISLCCLQVLRDFRKKFMITKRFRRERENSKSHYVVAVNWMTHQKCQTTISRFSKLCDRQTDVLKKKNTREIKTNLWGKRMTIKWKN